MGYDVAVIGGGVAGLSAAAFLADRLSVVVVEAEAMLSYHASGRSAALYTECYGPGIVPTLTKASRSFLMDRDTPLGSGRGVLFVADASRAGHVDDLHRRFSRTTGEVAIVSDPECRRLVPVLDPSSTWVGIHEPGALDLDIAGLESVYRGMVRRGRGEILLGTRVQAIDRPPGGPWRIRSATQTIEADTVVDAAGAWGDAVAAMAGIRPLELRPLRRSAFLAAVGGDPSPWPMTIDIDERWYFKPEGPNLLGSAADEIPSSPMDARPAEADIALGIERINGATTLGLRSVRSTWAGLRTFTPDRIPAIGPDPDEPTFIWLVGQGGYGIKTSPAAGELTAGLIVDGRVPRRLAEVGVTASTLAPERFR